VIQFKQSLYDFPCPVALGNNTPSFSLHRYKKGLRFIPPDDDGFVLRGDRRRLLYKGRRRSHRITILGDSAFEYDCILHKEPDTNVITLRMEGAEHYDFFRQPDFVKDPFLKGSYAVYKKTTLMGEGTGKLCHIHRPLIIDALGRRVWGELAVVGNVLCITIPEQWLAMAKYPVIVDPTVGTTTVGSIGEREEWVEYDDEEWVAGVGYVPVHYEGYERYPWKLYYDYIVNKYTLPGDFNGLATAYTYITSYIQYYVDGSHYTSVGASNIYPMMFLDINDNPSTRISTQEQKYIPGINVNNPGGWRSATFMSNGNISEGTDVWFGYYAGFFEPFYFDYGARCVYGRDTANGNNIFRDTFPFSSNDHGYGFNLKISTYFTYSGIYNRTLTQGVGLNDSPKSIIEYKRTQANSVKITDSPKLKAAYQRNIQHTAGVHSLLNGFAALYRSIQETIQGIDNQKSSVVFVRSLSETLNVYGIVNHIGEFYRGLFDDIQVDGEVKSGRFFSTKIIDTVFTVGVVFRGLTLLVRIITKVVVRDYLLSRFLKAREELILKSCITRALTIDSRIN